MQILRLGARRPQTRLLQRLPNLQRSGTRLAEDGSFGANVEAFAAAHGLTMHAPMSWTVQGFTQLLRDGPLWVGGTQPAGAAAARPSGHVVVVAAAWGNASAEGTMLLIYDPWSPRAGSIYGVFYGDRVADAPMMTTYILHR